MPVACAVQCAVVLQPVSSLRDVIMQLIQDGRKRNEIAVLVFS
jgi:hypothetical protein